MNVTRGLPTEVWAGETAVRIDDEPIRWAILAGGTSDNLQTTLRVSCADKKLAGSGFRGRGLEPDTLVNSWSGQTTGLPFFVMARVDPTVSDVVVTTDLGAEVHLNLSPTVDQFGLRFGATDLPEGHRAATITAVTGAGNATSQLRSPTPH